MPQSVTLYGATDLSNDRKLAGISHDIFFGRVTESLGQTIVDESPETHFRVEVLEVLKGSLSGTIKVSQQGGTFEDGTLFRMEGDLTLLEHSKNYLLATLRSPKENSHMVTSGGYGKYEILEGTGEPAGPVGNTGSGEGSSPNPGPTPAELPVKAPPGTAAPTKSSTLNRLATCEPGSSTPSENEIPFVLGGAGEDVGDSPAVAQPAQ